MSWLRTFRDRFTFLESTWFKWVSWAAAVLAPIPLGIQLTKTITAPSVEGIAIEAYFGLAILHGIMVLQGLKKLDRRIMVTFTLTTIIAAGIATVTFLRGGTFMVAASGF